MSGNKWLEQQKKAAEEKKKAEEAKRAGGVKTGAAGSLAEKRASVQAGLVPKAPGQAQVQSAPRAATTGPVAAKFGDKGPSSPKSTVKAKSVASALEGQMGSDAEARRKKALAMAQASRAQQEATAGGQTHASTRAPSPPSSPKAKTPSPQQQQQGAMRFDPAAARASLKKTTPGKAAEPAAAPKTGSSIKTSGYDPTKRKI